MPVIHETQLFFTAFDRIAYKLPTKSIIEFQTELPVPTSFGNYYLHCLKINPLNQFIRSEWTRTSVSNTGNFYAPGTGSTVNRKSCNGNDQVILAESAFFLIIWLIH